MKHLYQGICQTEYYVMEFAALQKIYSTQSTIQSYNHMNSGRCNLAIDRIRSHKGHRMQYCYTRMIVWDLHTGNKYNA